MIVKTITQIRDKAANTTQDQIEFGRWKWEVIGDRK